MRILWLPHLDWRFIHRGQREYRLARLFGPEHDVHFVTWQEMQRTARSVLGSLRTRTWEEEDFTIHQSRRVPNPFGQRFHARTARGLRINEWLFNRAVRRSVAETDPDVVICGISHRQVGLPPADLPVPLVFDYLDFSLEAWPELEREYLRRADAVLCTSRVLVERTAAMHPHSYYLPNGVDLGAAEQANGERVRRAYGLDGATVVSLIGVTASDQPFYVDALASVAKDVPNLVFLLVGKGDALGETIERRARERGIRTISTGHVPPSEVADFFAASDVGLYPGDKNAYFDAACPLKVLEYSAARKPVVATDLLELRNWGFPNLHLADPTNEAFAAAIRRALEQSGNGYPDLDPFRWSTLAERLLGILDEVAHRGKR